MNQSFFSRIYGLTTSSDSSPENGGLWFAEYLRLKSDLNLEFTDFDLNIYQSKMQFAKVSDGLYRRDGTRIERTVSHDEITGMLVASKLLGTFHSQEIWQYLLKHFFIYNPNNNRPWPAFAPQWVYLWSKLMGSHLFSWLFPYTLISILLTTKPDSSQETSGKLLYFTLLDRKSFLWKIYKSRMIGIYGENWCERVFSIYFHTEPSDHPLIELSRRYSNELK